MNNKVEKVYTEIGIGNESFLSTEIEIWEADKEISESRKKAFILPKKINEVYLRLRFNTKKVYILSSKEGFKIKNKDKRKFKIIFGIGGIGLKDKKNN